MGDVLICCGVVSSQNAVVDVAVPKHLVEIVKCIKGIRNVYVVNSQINHSQYQVESNFDGVFATFENLVDADYYQVAANKVGGKVSVAKLSLPHTSKSFDFVIHASSSNPNRDWGTDNWYALAKSLSKVGSVAFLGTKKEPGFTDGNIFKLSDITDDLVWQTTVLSNSRHFIGNDSGFCHLAGILGVQGTVLFFNTKPENVIKHYPSIRPVRGSGEPTGALNPLDRTTDQIRSTITLGAICELFGVSEEPTKNVPLPGIRIIGENAKFFKDNLWGFSDQTDNSIVLDTDLQTITVNGNVHIFRGGPYDLRRFLISIGEG